MDFDPFQSMVFENAFDLELIYNTYVQTLGFRC